MVESRLQSKYIGVSSYVLQWKHSGIFVTPKRYSFFFQNKIFCKILYWKERKYILQVVRLGNINIFVQSKWFALNFISKYALDVILLVLLEISIWYSSFNVNFSRIKIQEPFIKWWSWIMRFLASLLLCLMVSFHFSGIEFINCSHWKQQLFFRRYSYFIRCQALAVRLYQKSDKQSLNSLVET